MKFLRMRPGFGEQLIAEGDLEVAEDEQALIEEFRRQLDEGMWAAVPDHARRRPPRGRDGARVRRDPAGHRARHLLPARRRRRGVARDDAVIVALSATAIVVLALLWEISMPWIDRRLDARRRAASAAARARPAPRTTPAASAAPSSARASCSSRA